MNTFKMICSVPADFVLPGGDLFRVLPEDAGKEVEAPVAVRGTLLYRALMINGKISGPARPEEKPKAVRAESKPVAVDVKIEEKPKRKVKGDAK